MNKRHEVILSALSMCNYEITNIDLFSKLGADHQTLFNNDHNRMAVELSKLRDKRYIENGQTEYVDGRARLTWLITRSGKEALSTEIEDAPAPSASPIADAPKVTSIMDIMDQVPAISAKIDVSELSDDQVDFVAAMIGHMGKAPVRINDKDLKIMTIENLAMMLSQDISDVLMNVVEDLRRLEGA